MSLATPAAPLEGAGAEGRAVALGAGAPPWPVWVDWLLLTLLVLFMAGDAYLWATASDVWLHTDGHVHFDRAIEARRLLFEASDPNIWGNIASVSTYGPLLYLITATLFHLFGTTYAVAALASSLLTSLVGPGAYLMGRALHGRAAGLATALVAVTLPMVRIRALDFTGDAAAMGLGILALGALAASDGLKRQRYVLLAGVSFGLAAMVRLPLGAGMAPAVGLYLLWSLHGFLGRWWWTALVGLVAGGAGGALALGFVKAPSDAFLHVDSAVLAVALGVGVLLAHGLAWVRPKWRVPAGAVAVTLWACLIIVPWALFGREAILSQIGVQIDFMAVPEVVVATTPQKKAIAILQVVRYWQLGPILFWMLPLGALYIAVRGNWRQRGLMALLLMFAVVNDGIVIATKPSLVERWLTPGTVALLPVAMVWPFALVRPWLRRTLIPVVLMLGVWNAFAWHVPGAPGRASPGPWHVDILVYMQAPRHLISPSYSAWWTPWMTFEPYKSAYGFVLPPAFVSLYGKRQPQIAWMIEESARMALVPRHAIPTVNKLLEVQLGEAYGEDITDRVGGEWSDYDAWILVERTPGELADRFAIAAEGVQTQQQQIGEYKDLKMLLIWRANGPLPIPPETRMRGKELLPLGYGASDAGRTVPLPEL